MQTESNLGRQNAGIVNRLSQEEFEALFDNAALGIISVNPEGHMVMINQFALRLFGYERMELQGRKIETLIPARYREQHRHHRQDYQGNNPHQRPMGAGLDLWALRKDGTEFPVEISLSTYHNEHGLFSIAFISDITVRKASEDTLLRLNEELERKVEERTYSLRESLEREQELGALKSRFVSMASHEFRTPLSTILSSIYLISKYKQDDDIPKREKHIQRVISSVTHLTDILNDFLSVGKIEEGRISVRPDTLNIVDWISEAIADLEAVLKPGQEIRYQHTGSTIIVTDPSLLRHIVQNLISNASKFSDEAKPVSVTTCVDADYFSLAVCDEGIGIPKEDLQHLSDRFFRAANATNIQGTGLGLHIVSRYVEMMGGIMDIDSILGKGTSITLQFKR